MNTARPIPPQRFLPLLNIGELQELQQRHVLLLAILIRRQRWERQRRRWWVKPWIDRRMLYGQYHTLMTELERECQGDSINYMMMPPGMFRELVQRSNYVTYNVVMVVQAVVRSHVSLYKISKGRMYVRIG